MIKLTQFNTFDEKNNNQASVIFLYFHYFIIILFNSDPINML